MKTIKVIQSKYIEGSDGYDTAAQFNEAMLELAALNPKYERNGNSFWIFYSVEKTECEDIVDEHEQAGEKAHCLDCPYLLRPENRYGNVDARKKWGTCGKTGERTHVESRACEIYHSLASKERRRF